MFSQPDFSPAAPQYPDSMRISIPTDHEHWKLLALTAGVVLQAQRGYNQYHSKYMLLLDVYKHSSLDTISEVVVVYKFMFV